MTEKIPQHIVPIAIPIEKRIFDVAMSLTIIVLLSPLIILIVVVLCIENVLFPSSRGPILYKETRYTEGKPFNFFKFRIFTVDAIEKERRTHGIVHTKTLEHTKGAITQTGKILKQVYLDELPQLWNVLKGEMSLVGPRPTNRENMDNLIREKRYSKFLIRAGITGFFQSHKGKALNGNQEEYDMKYVNFVKNNPGWKIVLYDLKMLSISIITILRAEGI